MKVTRKCIGLWVLLLLPFSNSFAQARKIDSVRNALKTEGEDTNKLKTLNNLSYALQFTNADSTVLVARQAIALADKLAASPVKAVAVKAQKSVAVAYENVGTGYYIKGDFIRALDNDTKALNIDSAFNDIKKQSGLLNSIGGIYQVQGEHSTALDYYLRALKMAEKSTNLYGQARVLNNIGNLYKDENNYTEAIDYYQRALDIIVKMGNKLGEGILRGNIGTIYYALHNNSKAKEFEFKALEIAQETGNKEAEVKCLVNIGDIYYDEAEYATALEYEMKALEMQKKLGFGDSKANLADIGTIYTRLGKFKEAEEYLKKAITADSSAGSQSHLMYAEEYISQLYDTTGRSKLALTWYKKAMAVKDTLYNIDKNKALTRKQVTYEFEKKEDAIKAQQDKKDALAEEGKRKQNIVIWSIAAGLMLTLVFAGFIFRSLNITRKQKGLIEKQKEKVEEQKALIEHQKELVEEKNKEVLDSITYAKRLQDAILPPLNLVKQSLPESFLLYKPKDIVAGDFYWMERSGDNILIAAADCTGHGVPGAMVSVVCSNALNRTVKEFKIIEPGKILDKVRELVLETFEKSEDNVQDGMDISLCCINTASKETQWSGAFNSLWYVHNGEITEVPADKQPIGKVDKPVLFNTHNLNLQKGDTLYLFTDGYADQFGGPKGKKFKYKQLQELLLASSAKPMDEQKNVLENTLEEWKGNLEQVDDILIIGIRI